MVLVGPFQLEIFCNSMILPEFGLASYVLCHAILFGLAFFFPDRNLKSNTGSEFCEGIHNPLTALVVWAENYNYMQSFSRKNTNFS